MQHQGRNSKSFPRLHNDLALQAIDSRNIKSLTNVAAAPDWEYCKSRQSNAPRYFVNDLVTSSSRCTTHAVQYPQMHIIVLLKHGALYGAHLNHLSDRPALRHSQIFCFKRRGRRRPSGHSSRKSRQHDVDPDQCRPKRRSCSQRWKLMIPLARMKEPSAKSERSNGYLRSTVY